MLLLTSTAVKRAALIVTLVLLAMVLASCATGPLEPTWGNLSLYGPADHIVFAFSDRIVMLDPVDGSPLELRDSDGNVRLDDQGNPRVWEARVTEGAPTKFFSQPIVLDDDTMLAVSYDRGIFEINIPTARIDNPAGYALNNQVAGNSLLTADMLYVPFNGNNLSARTLNGFSEAWKLTTQQAVWSQPLLIDGVLYVTSLDHSLYALDPETGSVLWSLDLGGAITSAPLYSDGALYVGSFARKMMRIDLGDTGTIGASYDTRDWVWGTPLLQDGVLYFGDVGGNLYAIRDDGEAFSDVLPPAKIATSAIVATPVVTDEAIVVGSRDRNVYWLSRETGEVLVTRQMAGEVLGNILSVQPSETNGLSQPMIVVSTLNHTEYVVAFAADNGERLWAYTR